MDAERLVGRILDDESLTDGLQDPEARVLVEWLVEKAEQLAAEDDEIRARSELEKLCRLARVVRRFVTLWCYEHNPGAASQLAAVEKLSGLLPTVADADPCVVMQSLLTSAAEQGKLPGGTSRGKTE